MPVLSKRRQFIDQGFPPDDLRPVSVPSYVVAQHPDRNSHTSLDYHSNTTPVCVNPYDSYDSRVCAAASIDRPTPSRAIRRTLSSASNSSGLTSPDDGSTYSSGPRKRWSITAAPPALRTATASSSTTLRCVSRISERSGETYTMINTDRSDASRAPVWARNDHISAEYTPQQHLAASRIQTAWRSFIVRKGVGRQVVAEVRSMRLERLLRIALQACAHTHAQIEQQNSVINLLSENAKQVWSEMQDFRSWQEEHTDRLAMAATQIMTSSGSDPADPQQQQQYSSERTERVQAATESLKGDIGRLVSNLQILQFQLASLIPPPVDLKFSWRDVQSGVLSWSTAPAALPHVGLYRVYVNQALCGEVKNGKMKALVTDLESTDSQQQHFFVRIVTPSGIESLPSIELIVPPRKTATVPVPQVQDIDETPLTCDDHANPSLLLQETPEVSEAPNEKIPETPSSDTNSVVTDSTANASSISIPKKTTTPASGASRKPVGTLASSKAKNMVAAKTVGGPSKPATVRPGQARSTQAQASTAVKKGAGPTATAAAKTGTTVSRAGGRIDTGIRRGSNTSAVAASARPTGDKSRPAKSGTAVTATTKPTPAVPSARTAGNIRVTGPADKKRTVTGKPTVTSMAASKRPDNKAVGRRKVEDDPNSMASDAASEVDFTESGCTEPSVEKVV